MKLRPTAWFGLVLAMTACSPIAPSLSKTTNTAGAADPIGLMRGGQSQDARVQVLLRIPVRMDRAQRSEPDLTETPHTVALSEAQLEEFKRTGAVEVSLPTGSPSESVHGLIKLDMARNELSPDELNSFDVSLKQRSHEAWNLKVTDQVPETVSHTVREHVISVALFFSADSTEDSQ